MRKLLMGAALLAASCTPAFAQDPVSPEGNPTPRPSAPMTQARVCGDRAEIIKGLGQKYGETAHAVGLTNSGGVMEIFTSLEKGTWTILITNPGRPTCVAGAGEGWEDAPKGSQGEGA